MPNHITNKLTIIGSESEIKEILHFIKVDQFGPGTIDFDSITPMPKWVFSGNLGRTEEEKYGAKNCWYEWSCANWGTKWNAYGQPDAKRNTDNTIYFQTAWNGVPDLISKLAWIFPNVIFEYSYSDEDFGQNVAKMKLKDTEILEKVEPKGGTKEAYILAMEITQSMPEDHGLVFNPAINNYEYAED